MARVSTTWEPKGIEITKGTEVSKYNLPDYIILQEFNMRVKFP